MKKFILSVVLAAAALMVSGCYFFKYLSADVTVENNSSYGMYYSASYNLSEQTVRNIDAGKTETISLEGLWAECDNSSECFSFWYCTKDEMDAFKEEYAANKDNESFLITTYGHYITEKNKGQKYTVKINDKGTGYSVSLEYK